MKKTAKEGVKRGKNRAANHKVAPEKAIDKSTEENAAVHKSSRTTKSTFDVKEQDVYRLKKVANGRLPPIAPPVKILQQKSSDIELHEHRNERNINRKPADTQAADESGNLPVRDNTSRAQSPATRRRDENMTSYERMLQRENRRSRKKSVRSYTILHSEAEDQPEDCESVEGTTLVVENETQIGQSTASLRSRSSAKYDPNQALLQYFAKLSSSPDVDDSLDLEHVQSLLRDGASVNTCDRFGQTLLHEVSKTWGTDVAQFFIEKGNCRYCLCHCVCNDRL